MVNGNKNRRFLQGQNGISNNDMKKKKFLPSKIFWGKNWKKRIGETSTGGRKHTERETEYVSQEAGGGGEKYKEY